MKTVFTIVTCTENVLILWEEFSVYMLEMHAHSNPKCYTAIKALKFSRKNKLS